MSAFDTVAASGALEPIDLHFARLMRRRAGSAVADIIALTAALLSNQRSRGHSCIDLRDWAGRPFPADGGAPLPPLPALHSWRRTLSTSALVGGGSTPTPLVLDGAGRLYLSRYWHAEQRLANSLRERLENAPAAVDIQALAPLFRRLFPEPPVVQSTSLGEPTQADGQSAAAATALASRVTLVSGGPGTGKTTTVGRVLALLLTADPELRIALAAPTGKAAARLGEAVAAQAERLPIDDRLRARMPENAATLHRLLGYQPRHDRFRHTANRPLATDALVIDEVSMVDLLLMDAAIHALPPHARVILLGDKDQLTAVETGSVFGDLCTAAGDSPALPRSPRFADFYQVLSGRRLVAGDAAPLDPASGLLLNAAVELTTSYRFRDQPGVAELAAAVRVGDANRATNVLEDPDLNQAGRIDPSADAGKVLAPVQESLNAYLAAASPAQALEHLGRFRVLCARRGGSWGAERLNAVVEHHLASQGHPVSEGFYPARPILITANDYQLQLFNGDLGICWPDAPEARPERGTSEVNTRAPARLWAYFPGPGGEPRRLPLARLPSHETAWAMTVHKSQGSEFDRVLLVLGDTDSRVMTRELLYTGATRARHSVVIVSSPEVFRGAVARRSRRVSGLADALRGTPAEPEALLDPAPEPEAPPEPEPATEPEPEPSDDDASGQMSLFG